MRNSGNLTYAEVQSFTFEESLVPLKDRVKGIWKPANLSSALSITTTYRPPGVARPYEDLIEKSDGLLRYKWNGLERDESTNRALRSAMESGAPLIWFFGVGKGAYKPIFPVCVVSEEEDKQQFVIDTDFTSFDVQGDGLPQQIPRKQANVEPRHRLFRAVFQGIVMRAYRGRCAVCGINLGQLLDAVHIVPDVDADDAASVVNGIALCKLHHAAFDSRILGIRPDLIVQIRPDVLREQDVPVLRHVLQDMHGKRVSVPNVRIERPRAEYLERAFEKFIAAG